MSINQALILGIDGETLAQHEVELIKKVQPGGFILFGRNIKGPQQLRNLVDSLYELSKIPPLVCIDQEGGRVARLREIGQEPASAKELVDFGTLSDISLHGKLTGRLLRQFGINLDLCPVLDISYEGDLDNSLKNRCYGYTPEQVVSNARAFNDALRFEKIYSCGKHFPGYSRAVIDPHHELPNIERSREELESWEWIPFRKLVSEVDFQMIGHAFYPKLNSSPLPSSLNPYFIQKLLIEDLGFKGLVMTDDLDMGAIINAFSLKRACELALQAGNHFVLLCHRNHLANEALEGIANCDRALQNKIAETILEFKSKMPARESFSMQEFDHLNLETFKLRARLVGETKARDKTIEDAKRSPVEKY